MNEDKFIPKEKLSKKKKKELNNQRRRTWGELKPTSRVVGSKKAYNRNRDKEAVRKEEY